MARRIRILYPGAAGRLANRGVARQPGFRTMANHHAFLAAGAASHAPPKPRVKVKEMGEG